MTTLKQLIHRSGAIDVRRAVRYIDEVAEQLDALHSDGQIHRDVKPSMIVIGSDGRAVLAHRASGEAIDGCITESAPIDQADIDDAVDYLPPECILAQGRVQPATDFYGLGGTLFFLLLGRPPFPGASVSDRLLRHVQEPPEQPIRLRLDVPQDLSDLCFQMLAKKPQDRPSSATVVRLRLLPYREWRP